MPKIEDCLAEREGFEPSAPLDLARKRPICVTLLSPHWEAYRTSEKVDGSREGLVARRETSTCVFASAENERGGMKRKVSEAELEGLAKGSRALAVLRERA
jgi:hypothetical protein